MLSYQHAYHAGNLADVHKHALLAWMLSYLTQKDKPLTYIETHAGRGLYDLRAEEALKTGEAQQGVELIDRLGWFKPDHPYSQVLTHVRAEHGPLAYPGSPLVAALLLRDMDQMTVAELHPQEFRALTDAMLPYATLCRQTDGLQLALALTPPEPRRGLLLIDPSFEVKTDYETMPRLIAQLHRKWNVGIIALWYPILADSRHKQMLEDLEATNLAKTLRHEVRFPPAREGHGMVGSGMFIVNAPFGTEDEAKRLSKLFAKL